MGPTLRGGLSPRVARLSREEGAADPAFLGLSFRGVGPSLRGAELSRGPTPFSLGPPPRACGSWSGGGACGGGARPVLACVAREGVLGGFPPHFAPRGPCGRPSPWGQRPSSRGPAGSAGGPPRRAWAVGQAPPSPSRLRPCCAPSFPAPPAYGAEASGRTEVSNNRTPPHPIKILQSEFPVA